MTEKQKRKVKFVLVVTLLGIIICPIVKSQPFQLNNEELTIGQIIMGIIIVSLIIANQFFNTKD